jgi:type IV pilus assembly protein PilC
MPKYTYQARDESGNTDVGTLVADGPLEASRLLRNGGKTVLSISEAAAAQQEAPQRKKRIKKDDIIYFATQLAVMVDTGVPLAESLDAIAEQSDHPSLKRVIHDLSERVKAGEEFSSALGHYPRLFDRLFVALVKASEASGTMGQMLQRASTYMEQERDTRKQVQGALTYPVCMLVFCVLVVVGLLTFIMPRFEKIYAGKGAMLPLPTRILMGMSNAMVTYWPFILIGLVGAGVGAWYYFRTPEGRILLDRARIRVPILGAMYRKACIARSFRTMATMVATGVDMLEGIHITAQVSGNHFYSKIWADLGDRVRKGGTISEELAACPLMPRTIAQMVSAGEKTGKLSHVMNRVAQFCEDELRVTIKTITSLIEPTMIIIMGFVVGGIALALLLPVFSISKVVAN